MVFGPAVRRPETLAHHNLTPGSVCRDHFYLPVRAEFSGDW
jgi:hypothetical protein